MLRTLLTSLLALGALALATAASADPIPQPRLVRVPLGGPVSVRALQQAGLDLVEVRGQREAWLLEWPGDQATLAGLGAQVELVDASPGATAAARARAELSAHARPAPARVRSATRPDGLSRVESLPPFGSGSMGGYWTLDEVKMELDSLVANDPDGLVADKLDTLGITRQGRPIWGLRIGATVSEPDTRPWVVFNALTHAREPGGMQALFYFVNDLLSGYGSDPWKTYLLDSRRIAICPVVNPDGYQANVNTFVSSGGTTFGFWRKNARDNNSNLVFDSNDGVDINRNYDYKWNFDNVGSSGSPSSEIYRGPTAGSEPETQAQKNLIIALQPATALSFHTFSDLFLHAWGYQVPATPDSVAFYEWDDEATLGNGYASGQSTRVLYSVNGEFNDWCYGETVAKPKVISWTPEAGNPNDNFYPPPSRIVPISQENLRDCYTVLAIAGPYLRVLASYLPDGALVIGNVSRLSIDVRNIGLASSASGVNATLVSLDPAAQVLSGPLSYPTLGSRVSSPANGGAAFQVALQDTLTPGRLVRFRVEFRDGAGLYCRDTVEVPAGVPTLRLVDAANSLANWNAAGLWGLANDATRASQFLADSPSGTYPANDNAALTLNNGLDLSEGVHAWATFDTRWDLENGFDGTLLEVSADGGATWTAVAGRSSVRGIAGGAQPVGQPLWEGDRHRWRQERVDLSAFTGAGGTSVRLRFRTVSDSGTQFDGFNFDTLRVALYDPSAQPAPVAVAPPRGTALALELPAPNPTHGRAAFAWTLPHAGQVRLEVLDLQGRRVATLASGPYAGARYALGWDLRDASGRGVAPGVYLARLAFDGMVRVQRFVVLH
jgi:hypothetical protein